MFIGDLFYFCSKIFKMSRAIFAKKKKKDLNHKYLACLIFKETTSSK